MSEIDDGVIRETFGKMPPIIRHSISWTVIGIVLAVTFFGWVRDPLNAATATNESQDKKIDGQQSQINQLTNSVQQLVTGMATQQANIQAIQNDAQNHQTQLNRIENKIDGLRSR